MRVLINRNPKPLNHRVWRIIYLVCFLLGFCIQGKCEDTTTVHRPDRVTYEWQLLKNTQQWMHTWRLFYGETQREKKEKTRDRKPQVSDAEPTPHPPQIERRRQERREYVAASCRASRRLALPVRGQNHRRSHSAASTAAQGEGEMQREVGSVHLGGRT